ncbi:cystatin-like 1 [Mustela nigripes]|uniref:Cystatin-like 1 n=1 Tax=Mustela putorius furo TaxID=9669 RepID=A0A8U0MTK5_MUSPF|nr:cystatin-like 1 [Mustela putorius furo]XP_058989954.1 cystatin-like 1 [Mustela lutreola]XP_059263643.1 cystatin-like 1 [Mustela nigripes]
MGIGCWRNTLWLLAALVLAARLGHFQRWEGFQEKSMSKANMNSTLQFFMETYNNASNDTYLFQVDKLLRSQMQLTTGVEYMISVKISRTKCKRNSSRNSCPIQSKKKLKKSFICDFLVYTVPWMNYYQLWNNSCLEA